MMTATLEFHICSNIEILLQVESFVLVLRRLLDADRDRQWHIVDFGCGSGGLILPIACLFPNCKFTGEEGCKLLLVVSFFVTAAGYILARITFVYFFERPYKQ